MRSSLVLVLIVLGAFALSGCDLAKSAMDSAGLGSVADTAASAQKTVGGVDFKSGEVLASDGNTLDAHNYHLARVMTPSSPATKGEAEVLFIESGDKKWVKFVIPSHKASDAEMKVGKMVFASYAADDKDVDQDKYRKTAYFLKRITNTDELFKGMVEVEGHKYFVKWLRVPDQQID